MFASGLEGVVAARTELSHIDGARGELIYRGYHAAELAKTHSFEEVAHLLWYGHLPTAAERRSVHQAFVDARELPDSVVSVVGALPRDMNMMSVIRTGISSMGLESWPPTPAEAVTLTVALPLIVATRQAVASGRPLPECDDQSSHAAWYLRLLTGSTPSPEVIRALDAYWILTMEHGLNASTFAARVVTSTQSDLTSAVTAAIGAMKGPLHGGAPAHVREFFEGIYSVEDAERQIRAALTRGNKLMGFGHRLYKTRDPRAAALESIVADLTADSATFRLAVDVERLAERLLDEYKPGRHLHANVEYWAAVIFGSVSLPPTLFTPTFCASRMVGWTAHALEQSRNNRIIRPRSEYIGPMPNDC